MPLNILMRSWTLQTTYVPCISQDAMLLRMHSVTFTRAAKVMLKSLVPRTLRTCTNLHNEFNEKLSPPLNIAKLKKSITNFQLNNGESLYES